MSFLYGTIFTGAALTPEHHSRNVTVFAQGEVDRSSTGYGSVPGGLTKGELRLNEKITIESILGSTMSVRAIEEAKFGTYDAIIPEVSGTSSFTGRHEFYFDPADALAAYLTWSLVAFMLGRFIEIALMSPSAGAVDGRPRARGVALTFIAAFVCGPIGLHALVASSSFAITLRDLGPLTKAASSFLVMSIIGGAVLTALMGAVPDASGINFAILVVGVFAWSAARVPGQELNAVAAI